MLRRIIIVLLLFFGGGTATAHEYDSNSSEYALPPNVKLIIEKGYTSAIPIMEVITLTDNVPAFFEQGSISCRSPNNPAIVCDIHALGAVASCNMPFSENIQQKIQNNSEYLMSQGFWADYFEECFQQCSCSNIDKKAHRSNSSLLVWYIDGSTYKLFGYEDTSKQELIDIANLFILNHLH